MRRLAHPYPNQLQTHQCYHELHSSVQAIRTETAEARLSYDHHTNTCRIPRQVFYTQSTEVTARLAEGSLREQYEARLAASATENERLRAELHAAREKLAAIGLL